MCCCEEYGILEVQSGKEIRASCSRKRYLLWKIDCMKSKASGSHAFSLEYSVGSAVTHSIYHCAIGKAILLELSITGLKKDEIIGLLKKIALNAGL